MSEPKSDAWQTKPENRAADFRAHLRWMARRQWIQWSSAISVTILLTLALASFAFPGLLSQGDPDHSFQLGQAVRALVALVLLFNINAVYQQLQINRIQSRLSEQLDLMSKMGERTEEVFKMAALDPLTGLYNRRSGEQRLGEEMTRVQRRLLPLTIVMLDLNRLKYVNDTHGHAAGDELLKNFANCLNRAIRGSDLAVRLGGDEFMLVLPECGPREVRHVLGRLRNHKIEFDGQCEEISFSVGCADYVPGELREEFMKRADAELYTNKRAAKAQSQARTAARV